MVIDNETSWIKKILYSEGKVNWWRAYTEWKTFAIYITVRGLICRLYKELIKLNKKTTQFTRLMKLADSAKDSIEIVTKHGNVSLAYNPTSH